MLLDRVVVANNVVSTATWHGISLYSAINCLVVGNTLIDPTGNPYNFLFIYLLFIYVLMFSYRRINIWVSFDNKDGNPISRNNVVINNIMSGAQNFSSGVVRSEGNFIRRFTAENRTTVCFFF